MSETSLEVVRHHALVQLLFASVVSTQLQKLTASRESASSRPCFLQARMSPRESQEGLRTWPGTHRLLPRCLRAGSLGADPEVEMGTQVVYWAYSWDEHL